MRIPVEKMRSKRRDLEICEARHMAMFLIKKYTGASLSAIGKFFGNRDHTTVIHSIKHVNDMITTEKGYREKIFEIDISLKMPKED